MRVSGMREEKGFKVERFFYWEKCIGEFYRIKSVIVNFVVFFK